MADCSRGIFSRSGETGALILLLRLLLLLALLPGLCGHQDAEHITAILGEAVVFNCHVEFPEGHPVPYVVQWEKKGVDIPIYIWYENYPTHSGEGYEGRVSRVSPNSSFGLASLNLTDIRESDQGWYQCKVTFLNRSPNLNKNGTWFHLDVHAPPRFTVTPEEIVYVNLGDSIILNCQAEGTPTPEILWYKESDPVEPSATVGIVNDGTELRISNLRQEDIGDYICIARNGEGRIHHTAKVIIAGAAVIVIPPHNLTKLEGEKAEFPCEAKALPGNVTVRWFRESLPIEQVGVLETRVTIRKDGTLHINPVSADDSGYFTCEVTNGIGDPQVASAYLNVEYPARVTFTPTVQYLPFRLAGIVQCHIKSNPPPQFVTWTKDKRLLDPYLTEGVATMNNGSLLFKRVSQTHQGRYTCTPYNVHGTQGSSGIMEVLVRKPPEFTLRPEFMYQRKVGDAVEMPCAASAAEGTTKPTISWQRQDSSPLPRERIVYNEGNITVENLKRADFGIYQCVAANEVATIVTSTQLVVEGTLPHAPYNISANASTFAVTLTWLPGYSGGPDYSQNYGIWYRQSGVKEWSTIEVTPPGSTQVTIHSLSPGTTYEFQVVGKNALGDGMFSNIVKATTQGATIPDPNRTSPVVESADESEKLEDEGVPLSAGPSPGPPRNLTMKEVGNGFLLTWQAPLDQSVAVLYYTIQFKTDTLTTWKNLNKGRIKPGDTSFLVKTLMGGRNYFFKVIAHSVTGTSGASNEFKYEVPPSVKNKAITAGVVGGFLFFIVAIILSICAVKICNKRKRRKQEKVFASYNMVACRNTDARNGGQSSRSQVPLKKFQKGGPSVMTVALRALGHCTSRTIYDRRHERACLDDVDSGFSPNGGGSVSGSDDSGGFLTWRSLRYRPKGLLLKSTVPTPSPPIVESGVYWVGRDRVRSKPVLRREVVTVPVLVSPRTPRFLASSPATPAYPAHWFVSPPPPAPHNWSDLSSVPHPSSAERSFPVSSPPSYSRHKELPVLRTLYDWQQRPVRVQAEVHHEPGVYYPVARSRAPLGHIQPPLIPDIHPPIYRQLPVTGNQRPLATSSPPRVRPPNRRRPLPPYPGLLTLATSSRRRIPIPPSSLEYSPESRSSSSGFGSKNTSQQNQSSQLSPTELSGEWRHRPRPVLPHSDSFELSFDRSASVDDQYEFDVPTPQIIAVPPPILKGVRKGSARYESVEARVQAMKEEFQEYRMRQAQRRRGPVLESAC